MENAPAIEGQGGEKSRRYNLKPALRRWCGSIFGPDPVDKANSTGLSNLGNVFDGDRNDPDFKFPGAPPKRSRRSGTDSTTDSSVVVISEHDKPTKKVTGGKATSKETRDALENKLSLGTLKAQVRTLQTANNRLTKRVADLQAERTAEKQVVGLLKEQQKESGKILKVDDSGLRELITGYHAAVMRELTTIKTDLLAVKNTPLEITATTSPTHRDAGFAAPDFNNIANYKGHQAEQTSPFKLQPPAQAPNASHRPTPQGVGDGRLGTSYGRFDHVNGPRVNSYARNDGRQNRSQSPSTWNDMRKWARAFNGRDEDDRQRQMQPWDREANTTQPIDAPRFIDPSQAWKAEFYSGLGNQYAPIPDQYPMQRGLQKDWFPHAQHAPAPPVTTTFVIAKAPQQGPHEAPPPTSQTKQCNQNGDDSDDDTTRPPKPKRKLSKRK